MANIGPVRFLNDSKHGRFIARSACIAACHIVPES